MKTQAKKIIQMISAIVLTIVLAIPFALSAVNAAGPSDTAPITVLGVEDGATVTAYRIVVPEYRNGTIAGYVIAAPLQEQKLTIDDFSMPRAAEINKINSATLTEVESVTLTPGSNGYKAEVGAGIWLIKVSGGESIYNPMIVSAYYDTSDPEKEAQLVSGTVDANDSFMEGTEAIYAKKTEKILDKNIVLSDGTSKGTVAAIGDAVTFDYDMHIPVSVIRGSVIVITDNLDTGLTVDADSILVYNGAQGTDKRELVKDKEYTLTVTDHSIVLTLTGDFTSDPKNIENGRADLEVIYNAAVNEAAGAGFRPSKNILNAEYNTSEGTQTANTVTNYVFTLGIDHDRGDGSYTDELLKTDTQDMPLGDAVFTLYKGEQEVATATSANGLLDFKGLKLTAGINEAYILKETKAPEGYSLNTSAYKIQFTDILMNDAGQMTEYTIIITDPDNVSVANTYRAVYKSDGTLDNFTVVTNEGKIIQTKILNSKMSALPSTGGIGTTVFTVTGLSLIAASLILFMNRKNQNAGR